jgi:hypothetical protein
VDNHYRWIFQQQTEVGPRQPNERPARQGEFDTSQMRNGRWAKCNRKGHHFEHETNGVKTHGLSHKQSGFAWINIANAIGALQGMELVSVRAKAFVTDQYCKCHGIIEKYGTCINPHKGFCD